jgi:flavin reductase (DIM6/NTAB) family NADH-FMN oxidoreductase RutF
LNTENWKLLPTTTTTITTRDESGRPNAAPYGWVIGVSVDPWLIAFASDLGHKSWKNALATREFVVNLREKRY